MLNKAALEKDIKACFDDTIPGAIEQAFKVFLPQESNDGNDKAKKCGEVFCNLVSESWAKRISSAIDYYIKSGAIKGTIITVGSPAISFDTNYGFDENDFYYASNGQSTLVVADSTVILTGNDLKMYYKDGSKFNVTLTELDKTPLVNKTISFTVNDRTYNRITDEQLIQRLRAGEKEIMDYLMEKYKNLVRKEANAMYLLGGENDDLIQEGMIGLFKAVQDYDLSKESSFFSFAKRGTPFSNFGRASPVIKGSA